MVLSFLKKLKIELLYDLAIALLGIYPEDTDLVKSGYTFSPRFLAEISTIAKLQKEPRCSRADESIKKMWFISTIE